MVVVPFQVRRKIGHQVLYRQVRAGKGGKLFEMIKFLTIQDETN